MSRVTRARATAMRSNAILVDDAQEVPASPTATQDEERAPLEAIDPNNIAINEEDLPVNDENPPVKPKSKGKKSKAGKKAKKQPVLEEDENIVDSSLEVKEDESVSDTSDAVTKACEDLMRQDSNQELPQVQPDSNMSTTPPSPAVEAVRLQLQEAQSTRLSSPPNGIENDEPLPKSKQINHAQLVSPKGVVAAPVVSQAHKANKDGGKVEKDDQQDKNRPLLDGMQNSVSTSPKPLRIEDSVEAIDALEEAIEQVDKALPLSRPSSAKRSPSTNDKKSVPGESTTKDSKGNAEGGSGVNKSVRPATRNTKPVTASKGAPSKANAPKSARNSTQQRTSMQATAPAPSTGQRPSSNSMPKSSKPSQAPTKKVQPPTSLRPPPPPQKSTKPPTRSTFSLPGEAISRKLKEQREERLKQEEEEERKKREFKARPVRKSIAPPVKPTAASRARESLLRSDLPTENDHAPRIKAPPPRVSTMGINASSNTRRTSSLTLSKRSSAPPPSGQAANTSVRRSTSATTTTTCNNNKARTSTTFVPNASISPDQMACQKSRGKQVFERERIEAAHLAKQKKDKEEAAKLARVAAAERGRLASREWAEKQKRAKASAKAAEVLLAGKA